MKKKREICEEIIMLILKCDIEILRELNCGKLEKCMVYTGHLYRKFLKNAGVYI
jgi:hypothetical protein